MFIVTGTGNSTLLCVGVCLDAPFTSLVLAVNSGGWDDDVTKGLLVYGDGDLMLSVLDKLPLRGEGERS